MKLPFECVPFVYNLNYNYKHFGGHFHYVRGLKEHHID